MNDMIKIQARVENPYNLTYDKIGTLVLKDRTLVKSPLFWRNDNNSLWCYSNPIADGEAEFWIRIMDNDEVVIHCSTDGLLKHYKFDKFLDLKHIDNVYEFMLQEELLATLNAFIDNGILGFKEDNLE
jgi:hypothetical protein